jgi:hypothetical protein
MEWQNRPEPLVDFGSQPMPISIVCGKVWNCRDQLLRDIVEEILSVSYPMD